MTSTVSPPGNVWLRSYRVLLWLYPAEFRHEYAKELCLALVDRFREQQSRLGILKVWLHAALGILAEAPLEHLHVLLHDLRHAFRVINKERWMTFAAVATLALGIGSTTLVFSLVNGILMRPLPYAEPSRLVAVEEFHPQRVYRRNGIAFPNYQDIRARVRQLEDIGVYSEDEATIRGEGEAERVLAATVSDGVFNVLGVQPLMGRVFTRAEDIPKGPKVAVLSEDLWKRRYGSDPKILERTLQIGTDRYAILGVMPAHFRFPERAELWMPLQLSPEESKRTDYGLEAIARLKPGVSPAQASDELAAIMVQINKENPVTDHGFTARAVPQRAYSTEDYRHFVLALLGAVGFLLLIACANITNLLLVKATARVREMAVRTALGASRIRLMRQVVTESVLLAIIGGAAGVALTYAGIPALVALVPIELPHWMSFAIDGRVLGFALGVCLLTSLLFGLTPAFVASRVELTSALKEGSLSSTSGRGRQFLRHALVVGEVALSLTLLIGAGLMIRSFLAMRGQPLGYRAENVLTLEIAAPNNRYPAGPKGRSLVQQLTEEISQLPGVKSVSFGHNVPLGNRWGRSLTVEGFPVLALKDAPMINHNVVCPGFFQTLGIPLLEGRDFVESDWDNPLVTIVDRTLAKKYWPSQSALGKRIRFGPPESNEPWHIIIGVAGDIRDQYLDRPGRWNVYIPFSPDFSPSMAAVIRTGQDPLLLGETVRKRIVAHDPDIAVSRILSQLQLVDRAAWAERFFAVLFAVFAGLALLLAAVGLYGVLAYSVSLRTHEIGIRLALGATAAEVRTLVMKQGLKLTAIGLALGGVAALALTKILAIKLYQISPTDPQTFAAVIIILSFVAALASFVPARRATRLDPLVALRHE